MCPRQRGREAAENRDGEEGIEAGRRHHGADDVPPLRAKPVGGCRPALGISPKTRRGSSLKPQFRVLAAALHHHRVALHAHGSIAAQPR